MRLLLKRIWQVLWKTVLAEAIRRSLTAICRRLRHR